MNFLVEDAARFTVSFPLSQQSILFWVFASFVVHICQRLVEQAGTVVDLPSRRLSVSQSAMCIGCLVWALDVVGFFMYPGLAREGLQLTPALGALLIMTASARLTVPHLSRASDARKVTVAGLGLAMGMVIAHVTLVADYVQGQIRINPLAVGASIALAVAIAVAIALRHRLARLRAARADFQSLTWQEATLAGASIVPLHWCLINIFPIRITQGDRNAESVTLLVTLLVFGLAVGMDQLQNLRHEQSRQSLLNRALSLVRSSPRRVGTAADIQLSLIADRLTELISPDHLQMYFQPIVTAGGTVWQQEALLRIADPVMGSISPESFFLAAELQGKTAELDRMILQIVMGHMQRWQHQGSVMTVAVNIAPMTLAADDFADWLEATLRQHGLPSHTLKLELTEHAIIASGEAMVDAMTALRMRGIGVIMDDFGAGYSSLGVLAALPIEGIKCDRLFVRDLQHDPRRQAMLRHIAALARELGLSVTAEGMESREELSAVADAGIASFQGYLFAPALPATEVIAWHHRDTGLVPFGLARGRIQPV
jgi:EAL domain-containing protein (putative c-di-GMP-specific phosphodiesterase class I)